MEIAWYWKVIGLLVMIGFLYGSVWWIRKNGKGKLADWFRAKWPAKVKL